MVKYDDKSNYARKSDRGDTVRDKCLYYIRGLGMANHLVREGFDIVGVEDNEEDNYFKVFLFKDSEELRCAMRRYSKQR